MLEQLPPGSFTKEDANVIERSLGRVKTIKGACVEIGSDLGRSSVFIASIIKGNSHLFCIDIWSNEVWNEMANQFGVRAKLYPRRVPDAFEVFKHNIEERNLTTVVTPIRNKSEEALKDFQNPLKFIFIDGCHEYEYVKKDIEWVEYLVEGGEVVFHDYHNYTDSWPSVKTAVNEFSENRDFRLIDSGGCCVCYKKKTFGQIMPDVSEQPLVRELKIAAITMVCNEALLLPYFLRHYEYLDEIYALYETDSSDGTLEILEQAPNVIVLKRHIETGLDSISKVDLINNVLHTVKADWVYVVDCDEFIFPPKEEPNDFLNRQDRENYNIIQAAMFQVYRHKIDKDLDIALPPIPQRVHGDPDLFSTMEGPNKAGNAAYIKPIVVKPSKTICFQVGNHIVYGGVRLSPEFYIGAHWQMADPSIAIDRRLKNKARMSARNKRMYMGWTHWDVTREWIEAECNRHLDDPLIEELKLFSNKSLKNHELLTMRIMYKATTFELEKQERQLQELKAALESKLEAKDARIANLETNLKEKVAQIQQIQHSIPIQLVNRYQRIVEKLLRSGTLRRRFYEFGLVGIRVILSEGWPSFFKKAWIRIKGSRIMLMAQKGYIEGG